MIAPELPENEAVRLAELLDYRLLDTLPEAEYDDITRIAAEICETPIALISLVDKDRQWFKSHMGINVEETPRNLAFCAHAILEPSSMLLVEDATRDERFANNPLVTADPKVRFYAGVPLVTDNNYALGTLCVIDTKPKMLTEGQQIALQALGRQVIAQFELRRKIVRLEEHAAKLEQSRCELLALCNDLESQADAMDRDLERAELIQRSLLPHEGPVLPDFHVDTLYRPGHRIGGDFFDIKMIGDRYVAAVIADASGHGISAAMLSVLFQHRLELTHPDTGELLQPAEALTRMNREITREVKAPGVFVTAVYCLYDRDARQVIVCSAGHPPLIHLSQHATHSKTIEHTGPAIGLEEDAVFCEVTLPFDIGDRLLMFTDGLLDLPSGPTPDVRSIATQLKLYLGNDNPLQAMIEGLSIRTADDVTLVMLSGVTGPNRFTELSAPVLDVVVPETEGGALSYAETATKTFVCLRGRLTWVFAHSVMNAVIDLMEKDRPVVLDLAGCEYLDSTMLGTLHELMQQAEKSGRALTLQAVADPVLASFQELSLETVITHIDAYAEAIPTERRDIALPVSDLRRQRQRLIKAHEALSGISASNEREFASVIRSLKEDE